MKSRSFFREDFNLRLTEEEFLKKLALDDYIGSNIIDFFRDGVSYLISRFKDLLLSFGHHDVRDDVKQIEHAVTEAERNHIEHRYLRYRDVLVRVPEGFTGDFLTYAIELNSIGRSIFGQITELFTDYRTTMSVIISEPRKLESLVDLSSIYKMSADIREQISKRIARFHNNNLVARARLITVLPRFGDSKALIAEIKKLSKIVELSEIKKIEALVKDTIKLLDILEKQIKDGVIKEVSSRTIKNISDGAYELARHVDQIVVFYYASLSLIGCCRLLFADLKELET